LYSIAFGQVKAPEECISCDGTGLYGDLSGIVGHKNSNYASYSLVVGHANMLGEEGKKIQSSVVMGESNSLGVGFKAKGSYSFIFGKENTITKDGSCIIGKQSSVDAEGGMALGMGNAVNGNNSTAIGTWCSTTGIYGTAFGRSAKAAKNSTALGWWSEANGEASYTFGRRVKSTADNAMTIGAGRSTSYLENTIQNSLMIGINGNVPTLFVSESPAIDKSGRVGIGNITNPQAKLHIMGDVAGDASLLIETQGAGMAYY
jgi:hypothetical protein